MKKICVVTGSRADYGLLKGVMENLRKSAVCDLQIIATGMHLTSEFGSTWECIESDGFRIDLKVDMLLGSDTSVAVSKSVGIGIAGFADAFAALKPDLVLVLGDRFEIFSAAASAMIAGIPIAHAHGGELTYGSVDDSIRHAITKMANLHFTAAEPYRQRVIQLGEDPTSVWNVGGFGVDAALNTSLLSKNSLEALLGISISEHTLLITFHPETGLSGGSADSQMVELLAALEQVDARLIFTMPNADAGGRVIFKLINEFVSANGERACAHVSLGQTAYLSALALSAGVVGNSSSGLIEAPTYRVGTVNIGNRQSGRLKASSVIDCAPERDEIKRAIATLLSPGTQQRNRHGVNNPYGAGGAARRTVEIIEEWQPTVANKTFFDLEKVSSDLGRVCA